MTQRAALGNPDLVRYTTAVLLNMIAKGGVFIGVLVYAFEQDGAAATGLAAIALHVPAVVLAATLGALSERYRPHRVRVAAMVLQTAAFAVAAFAAFADLATPFVVSAGTIGIVAAASLGPAGAVLRPAIVRSSRELTVANLWTGYAHSVSVFVAPAMATLMLLAGGATAVLAACATIAGLAFVVSVVGHPADPPGGSTGGHVHALTLMWSNLGAVRLRHGVVGVLTVAGGQFFIVGALDIVIVVAAQTELGLGPSGPGVLERGLRAGCLRQRIGDDALGRAEAARTAARGRDGVSRCRSDGVGRGALDRDGVRAVADDGFGPFGARSVVGGAAATIC